MSKKWTRRGVIASIIGTILTCAISLWVYLNDSNIAKPYVANHETSTKDRQDTQTVSIASIYVSKVPMDIPSVFELTIQVGSIHNVMAKELVISLDFGRATVDTCDYIPNLSTTNITNDDNNRRRLEIAELGSKEKLYIRCLISLPIFEQVLISGENISHNVSLSYKEFQNRENPNYQIGFWTFLWRSIIVVAVFLFFLSLLKRL